MTSQSAKFPVIETYKAYRQGTIDFTTIRNQRILQLAENQVIVQQSWPNSERTDVVLFKCQVRSCTLPGVSGLRHAALADTRTKMRLFTLEVSDVTSLGGSDYSVVRRACTTGSER